VVERLPIDAVLPDVVAATRDAGTAVVLAPTGSGKTTRIPSALLEAGLGPVWLVVPRRIAARAAARRISAERGGELGQEVGYEVRFDRKVSARTRLVAMTDGILLRRLQDDPFLESVGTLVFDEFHERRLASDLGLALARRVRAEIRSELRIVVTSATLDPGPVSTFLGQGEGPAPVVEGEGRSFPVERRYRPGRPDEALADQVCAALEEHGREESGDALVFLPGRGEIAACARRLERSSLSRERTVLELHGDLSAQRQDAVFAPTANPKLILATNLAESSITIPGLRLVVDSGLARVARHDPAVGLDRLERTRISRASADQRAGRAGRTGPGVCVRLWSPAEERSMPAAEVPEVRRLDLAASALALLDQGEQNLLEFPWFEAPDERAMASATELLERLGATRRGRLTKRGEALARLPIAPRLGTLLLEGAACGDRWRAALSCALLSDRDPFRRARRGASGRQDAVDSDLIAHVDLLADFLERRRVDPAHPVDPGGARAVERAARQLARLVDERGRARDDDGLSRAILEAWPDRLARRRLEGEPRALMSGGMGVELGHDSRVTEAEYFVCVELLSGTRGPGREPLVLRASAFDPEWLDADRVEERVDVTYDPERDRVVGRRVRAVGDFELESRAEPVADRAAVEAALSAAAEADPARALDLTRDELVSFATRVNCLAEWLPDLELPEIDLDFWSGIARDLCPGCRSFADLRRAPAIELARTRLDGRQLAALESEAPERLRVPSGSQLRLVYEVGRPPVLAARIQELFGLRATPRVARGRVGVLMHLLAPNGRPQQITDDLESFWSKTYFEVRKELKRRYPKHAWPEDPTTAEPQRRPGRRRRP
jgi:ATP-dependent helicase HrpB